eukprot:3241099-Ditylum_brightwellii.AAC.1
MPNNSAPFKYPLFFVTGTSAHVCSGVHAVPAVTKSSAAHASNTKEATLKWIPPKNRYGAEGIEAGAPPPVFGGEGRRPVLNIDKGNAT